MKWILSVLFTLVTSVKSVPLVNDADATITSYDYQLRENGYSFSYTTSNGITRQESAVLVNDTNSKNDEDQIIRITGYYSYIDNDNNIFLVDYVADENGYNISRKEPSYPAPPVRGYSGNRIPKMFMRANNKWEYPQQL